MIPLKLRLLNFMCYREIDTLDFAGIHLACLTGDNGHGKSALLDAMTWALWGKARAKRDDELIHLGQTEMEVEFEFELGGNRYRLIRKRDASGRGRSVLELQVWDDGLFRPLTEPTIRATQERIDGLLRMDYETFINSAFLLQGRADEFTLKPPAERKRILGEILGLSIYDEYEDRAKERTKAREQEVAEITARIDEMDRELERRPEYEKELERAQADAARLSADLRAAEEKLRALREEMRALELKRVQIEDLGTRITRAERELAELKEQIRESEERLAAYEATLAQRERIEEGFAALTAARQSKEALDAKRLQLAEWNERKAELEGLIDAARRELMAEQRLAGERIRELEAWAGKAPTLEGELMDVRRELERLTGLEAKREAKREERQGIVAEITSLRTRNEQLRAEMDSLKEKIDMLERAEACCPLCGQGLTEADRDRLMEGFRAEGQAKGNAYRDNADRIKALMARDKLLGEEIAAIDRELEDRTDWQKREANLERSLAEARQAAEDLVERRAAQAKLEGRLERGEYASAEQAELAEIKCRLEELGYDPEAHEQVRQDIEVLSVFEEEQARLQAALEHIDGERANLERLQGRRERWRESLKADVEKRESLSREVAKLGEVAEEMERARAKVEELQGAEAYARQVLGAARQKLDHCHYLAAERKRQVEERDRVAEEKTIYDELRVAFGKKGLQAMIIESAIPEIEEEANALLARMTDNRMHVRFETQRETKKGDTIETLDIKISDELGTRSYELYSGGEAFRANFAIRIALSKLLARRAGARLQTLVIDEGFGTQDTQGRERLVEAINSIQEDFEKIIVITHIEELKDAFPVRIDVFKTPQGSQIAIH